MLDSIGSSLLSEDISNDKLKTEIEQAHQLVQGILGQVRELSLDLRPGMLDDLGILPTLLAFLDRLERQEILKIDFKHKGMDRRFNTQIETAVFRVIQEAITNVTRHAKTQEVSVRLWCQSDSLGLQVKDTGVGFNPENVLTSLRTAGLAGIKERITLCGGNLTIESKPNEGTCITAEIPIS
jgi:signal transduction histidine kinase